MSQVYSCNYFWGPSDLDISIYSDSVTSHRETTTLCDITQQCFALALQANFPAYNLNFHWRWSDWFQATFEIFFYFNNFVGFWMVNIYSLHKFSKSFVPFNAILGILWPHYVWFHATVEGYFQQDGSVKSKPLPCFLSVFFMCVCVGVKKHNNNKLYNVVQQIECRYNVYLVKYRIGNFKASAKRGNKSCRCPYEVKVWL